MTNKFAAQLPTEIDMMLALQEFYPDRNHGAIAIDDRHEALQAYLAFEDGSLAEVPEAFDAHVRYRQFNFQ